MIKSIAEITSIIIGLIYGFLILKNICIQYEIPGHWLIIFSIASTIFITIQMFWYG